MPDAPTLPSDGHVLRQWREADRLASDAEAAIARLQATGYEPSEVQQATARQLRAAAFAAARKLRPSAGNPDRPRA